MRSETYHLQELAIANSPKDPRRIMPPISETYRHILDVGCGAGQTLIASNLASDVLAYGLDLDFSVLCLGKQLTKKIHFVCGTGVLLPFKDNFFDLVIAQVALPYMHISKAIEEINRVLKPKGNIWFTLHSFSMTTRQLMSSLRCLALKDVLLPLSLYILANSITFHLLGKQFNFPLNRRRCESFQTSSKIKKVLYISGFENIKVCCKGHFVVTATKSAISQI